MSGVRLLDTNVLMRYLTGDDLAKAERGRDLLARVERGDEAVAVNHLVIFEIVFLLQKSYGRTRADVRVLMATFLAMRGVRVTDRDRLLEALPLYEERNISFVDAYNAVYMREHGMTEVYSWDSEFDRVPWLTRVTP